VTVWTNEILAPYYLCMWDSLENNLQLPWLP